MSIPSDIITQILYRLPTKSLGRFKCVSKEWLSLISDSKFIRTHSKTTNRNHIIFYCSDDSLLHSHPFNHQEESLLTPTKFHLKLEFCFNRYDFRGSCDGLVLVCHSYFHSSHTNYMLYNQTTRESVYLPDSGYFRMMDDNTKFHDCLDIEFMDGFVYDYMTDDYKVVSVTCYSPSHNVYVHVYSRRTNTWRLLVDMAYDYSLVYYHYDNSFVSYRHGLTGVYVNGFIHWIVRKNSNGLHVIGAFSLADEIFSEVTCLNLCQVDVISKNDCRLFAAVGGKLAILVEREVWLMNDYGKKESWTKILLHGLDPFHIFDLRRELPTAFDENGRLLVASNHEMFIYNVDVEKGTISKTVYEWNLAHFLVTGTCVESLLSPKFNTTC